MSQHLKIETINFKEEDTVKTIFAKVPGGVDCSLECAGFEYPNSTLHKVNLSDISQNFLGTFFEFSSCFSDREIGRESFTTGN